MSSKELCASLAKDDRRTKATNLLKGTADNGSFWAIKQHFLYGRISLRYSMYA